MKKLYRSLSFAAVLMLLFTSVTLAQERVVTGKVTDENGGAMPGVNVLVKGTANGTATDGDGNFSLSVPNDQATLVFSFVGYTSSEVAVAGKTSIDLQMSPDVTTLSELVVTGYQVLRKKDISGAVAVINTDELTNLVASSVSQKLGGRVPGVTISTSGRPGDVTNVRVRGISSFGNNDPLFVIDGVQITDKRNIPNLNPSDIESMQVLKDPSTAAIYGSAGSNGVIVITTKQGKAGKPKLTYNGSYSLTTSVKGWDDILITDSNEYLDMTHQFFDNGGAARPVYATGETLPRYIYVNPTLNGGLSVGDNVNEALYDRYTNPIMRTSSGTNWWEEITRTGHTQDHYVNLSGGTDAATFSVGAGALLQEGVLKFNDFNRYNVRANSNYKIGKKFRVGQTLNFTHTYIVNNVAQSEQGALSQVYKISPLVPVYDIGTSVDDEGLRDSFGGAKTSQTGNANNPYAVLFRGRRNPNRQNNLMGNFFGEVDLIKGLTFKSDFKFSYGAGNSRNMAFRSPENEENTGAQNFQENWNTGSTLIWTNTVAYNTTIADKHTIGFVGGYEAQDTQNRNIFGSLNNYTFSDEDIWYLNTAFGASDTRQVNSNGSRVKKLSTFGKLDYNMADKYYLSATVRRDGSSNFSEGNQYGVFPAFGAAWRISGESFLSGNPIISDLKLRLSWGIAGNDGMPPYNYSDRWGGNVGSAFYAIDGSNGSATAGYHLANVGTLSLGQNTKWEESETTNFGIDASLLDDKFSLVLDIYQRKTRDLLYNAALPGTFGYLAPNAPFRNTAAMTNTGFDLGLGYRAQVSSDLNLSIDLNVSRYKNVIDRIDGIATEFSPNATQGRIDNRLPTQININRIGYSMSSFQGYRVDGIWADAAQIAAANAADGNAATPYHSGAQVGGLRFKDLNGDNRISEADLDIIGNPHPDFTYGLNIGASYKNFDLAIFFTGSQGNDIFNYTRLFTHFRQFNANVSREYYQNNGTGGEPRLNVLDTSSRQASEYYVENGSYLRLGQLQLGYTVPLAGGIKNTISRLKLYVQGQNLFTITGYSGLDPALSNANIGDFSNNVQGNFINDMWTGFDVGQYPNNKLFTFGISAEF